MLTKENIIAALKQCNDPELGLNVWFLGLVYDILVEHESVRIKMTFTTMFCPYGPNLVEEVKEKVRQAGAKQVDVEVVFEPKWEPSEEVKMALGL